MSEILPAAAATTAALSNVMNIVKGLVSVVRASGKVEVVGQLLDLQQAMLEIQQEQFALIETNQSLRSRVQNLEEQLTASKTVEFHYDLYWTQQAEGKLDGPFLPTAWDESRKLVRMQIFDVHADKGQVEFSAMGNQPPHLSVPVAFLRSKAVDHVIQNVKDRSSGTQFLGTMGGGDAMWGRE